MENDMPFDEHSSDVNGVLLLLDKVCNGTVSAGEVEELKQLLHGSPTAIDDYIDRLHLEASLQWDFSPIPVELSLSSDDDETAVAAAMPVAGRWRSAWHASYDVASNYIALSLLVSGLFFAILLLSMAQIVPDWKRFVPGSEIEQPSVEFVAHISATSEAAFDETSEGNFKNRDLFADNQIVLDAGLVVITYDTGARVVLEGPATYQIQGANGGNLRHGKLVARVDTKESQCFAIDIPGARIVDLGTEFGVEVPIDGVAEVAVLSGKIELIREASASRAEQRLRLSANEGATVAPSSGEISRRGETNIEAFQMLGRRFDGRPMELAAFEGVIYIDCSHPTSANYTVGSNTVNVRKGNGTTFNLQDVSGVATTCAVTLAGTDNEDSTKGLMPRSGTDAHRLFDGFVNATGVVSQTAGTTTVTFTGLNPTLKYDVALLSNRIDDDVVVANTTYTINDVEVSSNISSVVTAPTKSAFDSRSNTRVGNTARWNAIAPGADGDLVLELTVPRGNVAYLNAIRLAAHTTASDREVRRNQN